jgi:Tol biopolymer transport system component
MGRLLILAFLTALAACQSAPPRYDFVVATERNGQPMALYATDIDTTYWELLVPGEDSPYGPAWSPDGQTIAYTATADSVRTVFFLKDGQTTNPVENGANGASVGGFSPDGTQFLYAKRTAQASGHIMRLDLASGESTQLTFTEDYNTTPVFTPMDARWCTAASTPRWWTARRSRTVTSS